MRPVTRLLAFALSFALLLSAVPAGAAPVYMSTGVAFNGDGSVGYLAGVKVPTPKAGQVSTTANQGVTWTQRTSALFSGRHFEGVAASGANAAVVSSIGDLFVTSNSGATWSDAGGFGLSDAQPKAVAYLPGGRLGVVGQKMADYYGMPAFISARTGSLWSVDYLGPKYPENPDTGVPPSTRAELSGIAGSPGGTASWAVGGEWDTPGTTFLRPLIFKNSSALPSVWTTQTVAAPNKPLTDVSAYSDTVAFAVGTAGTLIKTNDGTNWSATSTFKANNLNAVAAVNSTTAIVAGTGGLLGIVRDVFTTPVWTWVSTGTTSELRDIAVVDADTWVVVGDEGTVRRTDDAGATWNQVQTAPKPTAFTFATKSVTANYGAYTTVSGYLKSGTAPVAGQQIILQTYNGKAYVDTSLRATTSATGSFSFRVRTYNAAYYKPRFAGNATWSPSATSSYVRITPKASVTNPVAPTTMYRNRKANVYGYVSPAHSAGISNFVRLYFYRYQKLSNGKYGYVLRKTVYAKSYWASGKSKYLVSTYLPYAGRWRVRAYHADATHAASWSPGYDYITVR
jgi:photosystem II stability/assembly factor-like uncharacterized protein